MTYDPTESARRAMLTNDQPSIDVLTAIDCWSTDELREQFTVLAFLAPFVVVVRKADGHKGTMEFTHHPRVYFNFVED